jgi:hypothetical protein
MPTNTQALIAKIQALPAERIAEIDDFVEFIRLRERERTLVRAFCCLSPSHLAVF